MEINITSLLSEDVFNYSHSAFEGGDNAGRNTWNAAKERSQDEPLLTTPKQLDALRDYVKGFGAWTEEEIAAWDDNECNALFLQMVSGDIREAGADSLENIDWEDYKERAEAGNCSSNLFKTKQGEIFYSLSN
jgi:hypothetical protein